MARVKVIWFASKWNLRVDGVLIANGLESARWIFDPPHIHVLEKELRQEFQRFASVLIDKVWQARNASIHEGKCFNPYRTLNVINNIFLEFSNSKRGEILRPDSSYSDTCTCWLCPATRRHWVFVNAAFKNGHSAAGVVAWDHVTGSYYFAYRCGFVDSSLKAELFALKITLKFCHSKYLMDVDLYVESQEVMTTTKSLLAHVWSLWPLCLHIFTFSALSFNVIWIPKTANRSVHELASWAF
ncbi:Ribonuclease H-like domain containing protein [Parasponia andersonii]|uniref:Ribonuclease H-like domain containing protein n=1 Tax=Parasponia andersonii TaxID=3476 RepID=A0A2P5CQZ0_PARAD|nr:Ribonuclease H-like domain containing protein [Parasponia andersonii]